MFVLTAVEKKKEQKERRRVEKHKKTAREEFA